MSSSSAVASHQVVTGAEEAVHDPPTNMAQITITDAIAFGYDRDDIAKAYHIDEMQVSELQQKNDELIDDESVAEEEFLEWCDKTDADYGTAEFKN